MGKVVFLLHDNAPGQTAAIFEAAIQECGLTDCESYSLDLALAPSDYLLFAKLKADLRGQKFDTDKDFQKAVLQHIQIKDSEYFFQGVKALIKRCEKCIQIEEAYVEK